MPRPADAARRLLLALLAAAALPGRDGLAQGASGPTASELQALDARMAAWVSALRERDVPAFLDAFSRRAPTHYRSTLSRDARADSIAFERLQADMSGRTGWYQVFFDAGGDDTFRDHVADDKGRPWQRRGTTFTPPGSGRDRSVYVRWRLERGRWVIDTVAEPSS